MRFTLGLGQGRIDQYSIHPYAKSLSLRSFSQCAPLSVSDSQEARLCCCGTVSDTLQDIDATRVAVYDLHARIVSYEEAWNWQRQLVAERLTNRQKYFAGSLLLLQHPPVLTLGAGSTEEHLRFDPHNPPLPLFRTERGGEVTYHGPGQLLLYPVIDLQQFEPDLHWYLRSLEEVVIRALHSVSGLHGERCEGLTGVWVGGSKVAAIGIRARRWVAFHGLALNVTTDLQPYTHIVPCGISEKPVTSVKQLLEQADSKSIFFDSYQTLISEYAKGLLAAFADVFGSQLIISDASELGCQQQSEQEPLKL